MGVHFKQGSIPKLFRYFANIDYKNLVDFYNKWKSVEVKTILLASSKIPKVLRHKWEKKSESSSTVWFMLLSDTLAWCTPQWKSATVTQTATAPIGPPGWPVFLASFSGQHTKERLITSKKTLKLSLQTSVVAKCVADCSSWSAC